MQKQLTKKPKHRLTYCKCNEDNKLTFFFNKELKCVDIEYQFFERNDRKCNFVPQAENKYSCEYGHWQVETPCLSVEDIEFLYNKSKEVFGYEKDGDCK